MDCAGQARRERYPSRKYRDVGSDGRAHELFDTALVFCPIDGDHQRQLFERDPEGSASARDSVAGSARANVAASQDDADDGARLYT